MNQREQITLHLDAIVTASTSIVKRLKRLGARQVMTAQFVNLSVAAMKLKQRQDYLLPTYRRYAVKLEEQFDRAMQDVHNRYPDFVQQLPPSDVLPAPTSERTKTIRVSLTLREEDWELIDSYIGQGHVKTYAGYFRRLVRKDNPLT